MCDTLVAVGKGTKDGRGVLFGKNSDRPYEEQQPLVYYPHQFHNTKNEVDCTHISIPQTEETYAILLSQPSWMRGGEMGVNEHNVVIGNEAVWTKEPYRRTGLLGMDLLRLALERSVSARQALEQICLLLEIHGQGGSCGANMDWYYHNSFIIADPFGAWVLETADQWWIAEQIKDGVRNISNNLSIHNNFDLSKDGLVDYAVEKGYCNDSHDFDFANAFSEGIYNPPSRFSREGYAREFLQNNVGNIDVKLAIQLLRDHTSGICMHGGFRSTASQASWLIDDKSAVHWFTASPHPCISVFKPITCPPEEKTTKFSLWKEREDLVYPMKDVIALELHDLENQLLEKVEDEININKYSSPSIFHSFEDVLEKEKKILQKVSIN